MIRFARACELEEESGARAAEILINSDSTPCTHTARRQRETINIDAAARLDAGQQPRRPFQEGIPERRLMTGGLYYCVYVNSILILTAPDEPADVAVFEKWSHTEGRSRRA